MAQIIKPSPDLMHSTTNGTTYMNVPIRFDRLDPPEPIAADRRTPNAETIKAIEDTLAGKNVVRCTSADDMFRKLGI